MMQLKYNSPINKTFLW